MILLRAAVGAAALLLLGVSPPLREALVALEPIAAPALFLTALAWGLLGRWRRDPVVRRRARRLEGRLSRWLARWGWAMAVALALAPLLSHWALRPPGRIAAISSLLGRIPWSDANGHYEGGTRMLAEGRFSAFSERRPLSAAWLATRLLATRGDLDAALVVQAVLLGLALWLFAQAVALRHGLAAGVAAFAVTLALVRTYVPGVVTEPNGIVFACLGLVVLLSPRTRLDLAWLALGLLAVDAALRARPGPQFLVPCLILWATWLAAGRRLRAAAVLAAVVLAGALHTRALNAWYGSGEASETSYPAFTFYGLAHGTNYEQAYRDFGDAIERTREDEMARILYAKAWERLRREPGLLVQALVHNLAEFLQKAPLNLELALSPRALIVSATQRIRPADEEIAADKWAGGVPLLAAGVGFLAYLARARGEAPFWLACALGVLASAPIVFGDAGFRGFASAYPVIALALGIGVTGISRRLVTAARVRLERANVRAAAGATLGLLALCLVGPALAHATAPRPPASLLVGVPPGELVIRLADAPVVLVSQGDPHPSVPTLSRRQLQWLLQMADYKQATLLENVDLPFLLLSAYDYASKRQMVVVASPKLLETIGGFARVEVQAQLDSPILQALSWQALR